MDSLEQIQTILNNTLVFDGNNETYGISGELVLPDGALVKNATFIQLSPETAQKTIKKQGGWIVGIQNITIDRGTNKYSGTNTNSAAIYLENCRITSFLEDIEIYGHGKGVGLYLLDIFNPPEIKNIYVHDMRFASETLPQYEQLCGIWLNQCSNITLLDPKIYNLGSDIPGQNSFIQTDAITVSGGYNINIIRPDINSCGEGIDFTGSLGNRQISIIGGTVKNCDSFGIKLANSVRQALVYRVIVENCGLAGFVISGPSEANLPLPQNIDLVHCKAINIGSNGNWASYLVSGFCILSTQYNPSYPQNVQFHLCTAEDTQLVKTMKYGFRNETNNASNLLRNCSSIGYTTASTLGVWG